MAGISDNRRRLSEYSSKMAEGDYDAVYDYWSDDFFSHVTERVNPAAVGTDVRGEEREFWEQGKHAFADFKFSVNLVLESGDIRRVGDNDSIKVDVRVVCATHRNLIDMVEQGEFREERRYGVLQSSGADVASQLETLEGMLDRGTLTQEEFDAQKRKLLG